MRTDRTRGPFDVTGVAIPLWLAMLVLLLFPHLEGRTQDGQTVKLSAWSGAAADEWWQSHPTPDSWIRQREAITAALQEAAAKHGLEKMANNPHWIGWMIHARWLSLFPSTWQGDDFFKEEDNRELFVSMHRHAAAQRQFLAALVPEDDALAALKIFCRIARAHPDAFLEYSALAVAFSIVFDQPIPKTWPHVFVDPAKLPLGDADPTDRFAFLVQCQEEEKLLIDPRTLSVRDLTFAVDTPLELTELRYAQQVNLGNPERLRHLYPVIPYDSSRINSRRYAWPGETYRLIDIGKRGGICMDLAFFVSQTGKAQGVPTLLFVGQGLSGEHGWVGFLKRNGRWDLEVARNRGEEYPIGQAYDPQTWERITDVEMEALVENSERFHPSSLRLGHVLLQWAALNTEAPDYAAILRAARRSMPRDPRPWRLEAEYLERSDAPVKEQLAFWNDWSRHFSDNVDLQVKGQVRAIAILEEAGREDDAERLRQSVISQTRSKRFDLGIAVAADPIFRRLQKREWEAAEVTFEKAMRRFRSKAGGHLFYHLLQPYVLTCLQEGRQSMAEDALKYLDRGFEAEPGTMLENNMKELERRVQRK